MGLRLKLLGGISLYAATAFLCFNQRLRGPPAAGLTPSLPPTPSAQTMPHGNWVNVTHNVGGDKWGFAGVTTMAVVPGSDEVLAGVSEQGIWSTTDGGKSWNRLGPPDKDPVKNRPYQILFDPKDPKIFWASGNHGPGICKTADGGRSFTAVGPLTDVDGIGVDFTDPERKTIVVGHHDQDRSIERSPDAGKTWEKIGQRLPEKTNFSDEVIVFDAKTYVVNSAGWKQGLSWGIFRTEDGGNTWAKVSDLGPDGAPLVASDGAIYWQALSGCRAAQEHRQGQNMGNAPRPRQSQPHRNARRQARRSRC